MKTTEFNMFGINEHYYKLNFLRDEVILDEVYHVISFERIRVSKTKWSKICKAVESDFNYRLKQDGKQTGKFEDKCLIDYMLGKELMVLLWRTEGCKLEELLIIIASWKCLEPAERWWLYTMTNAATGKPEDNNRGWRVALKYALADKREVNDGEDCDA